MYLMASTECRISAKRIQRETGVTYKTAWRTVRQLGPMIVDEQPADSAIEIDNQNLLSIRQNHGSANTPNPDSDISTGTPQLP
jgi:hypothetical protein